LFEINQRVWVFAVNRFGVILSLFHRANQMWAVVDLEDYHSAQIYPCSTLLQKQYRNVNVEIYAYFKDGKLCASRNGPEPEVVTAKTAVVMKVEVK